MTLSRFHTSAAVSQVNKYSSSKDSTVEEIMSIAFALFLSYSLVFSVIFLCLQRSLSDRLQ